MNYKELITRLPEDKQQKGLWPVEWAMLVYGAFTLVLMAVLAGQLVDPLSMLGERALALGWLVLAYFIYHKYPCRVTQFLRIFLVMSTLSRWYPDTYEFNRLFSNLDHIFASWDQSLFGCQPSLRFSELLPQAWFSEALYLGYFSYFPMIFFLIFCTWLHRNGELMRTSFIVMASFFTYYVVYIFLPVAGPQYYYQVEGVDPVNGVFPNVGHYFHEMREMYPAAGTDGLFHSLVSAAHDAGERPTAAFPSSHIGVATIVLILALRNRMRIFSLAILPLYICLCMATVYIHAHYLVDAIAGFFSAFIVYFLLSWVWRCCFARKK